jgi:tRNA-uridine 2-sulfurtransferase
MHQHDYQNLTPSSPGKVLVWMSWWVDSAVAAYLLMQEWYQVIAGFMKNYANESNPHCQTKQDRDTAIKVAQHLGITTFIIFDFRKTYHETIISYIYDGYRNGITPNPDVLCNSKIKFDLFLEHALELWCTHVATWHYARILAPTQKNWPYALLKGVDTTKDQSYFLSWLNQRQLSHALFPLGNLHKTHVREIAHHIGLPNAARKDSQGLCFIGKVRMQDFLQEELPIKPWPIITTTGKYVWTHKGTYFYTRWQREWLGIGWGIPYYVVDKNNAENTLIVGTKNDDGLFDYELTTVTRHRIHQAPKFPFKGAAKIRYRQEDQEVIVTPTKHPWQMHLAFIQPQRAISSWQTVAVYAWDNLIWSWIIS